MERTIPFLGHNRANATLSLLLLLSLSAVLGLVFHSLGFGEANIIMIFLLAVLLVSILGGRAAGIVAAGCSVIIFNFLFTEPRFTLVVHDTQYLIVFFIMFIVALITSELTSRIRREAQESRRRAEHTEKLYQISRSFLRKSGFYAVSQTALENLYELTGRSIACRLYIPSETKQMATGEKSETELLLSELSAKKIESWILNHSRQAGSGTSSFSDSSGFYFPLIGSEQLLGILCIFCQESPLSSEESSLVEAIAAQLVLALDREVLSAAKESARMDAEKERLRSDLLRSISHDLRSPLTAISGAGETLLEEWERLSPQEREELLQSIKGDASWLTGLIENLLSLTRVEGGLNLVKEPELAEDILVSAVERCRPHSKGHNLETVLPDEPLMVPMDAHLIQQTLINLIDNAIRYSHPESPITVWVENEEGMAVFSVSDTGPGIPEEKIDQLFERFRAGKTSTSDGRRGLGIGLTICKSIVEAHNGSIEVRRNTSGGAIFRFALPFEANKEIETG